jgi:predicted dehydrogenase
MRLTRRGFARGVASMGAMGVAGQWMPRGFAQAATVETGELEGGGRRIGYAVIGLGRIATHFLQGTRASAQSKITALVSGHRDKAERIAAQYGVPTDSIYSYEDFDKIAANKAVDAVYVALPNSMHAEYTIRAAKAGKHVLCEKPMDVTSAKCVQMIDACKAAKVKLMIAYRLQYEPMTLKALDMVKSGKFGKIQSMEANKGSNIRAGEWRITKALGGGGAMFDHGVYCINTFRMFTGEEPVRFNTQISTPDRDGRFNEVEENVSWVMGFPSGALALGAASYGNEMGGFYRLQGPWGFLADELVHVPGAAHFWALRFGAGGERAVGGVRRDEHGEGPDAVCKAGGPFFGLHTERQGAEDSGRGGAGGYEGGGGSV